MELEFLTPQASLEKTTTNEVTAPGIFGEFGILPGHAAYLTELGVGRVVFQNASGKEQQFIIRGGYAEAFKDQITLMTEEAIAVEAIDKAQAQQKLKEVEAQLEKTDPLSVESSILRQQAQYLENQIAAAR